jgi:hypothetical protein
VDWSAIPRAVVGQNAMIMFCHSIFFVVTSELTGGDSGSSMMGFEDGGCTEITCRDSGSMMDCT